MRPFIDLQYHRRLGQRYDKVTLHLRKRTLYGTEALAWLRRRIVALLVLGVAGVILGATSDPTNVILAAIGFLLMAASSPALLVLTLRIRRRNASQGRGEKRGEVLMKTFSELVKRETQTCFACPDIRELTLVDGSRWYVRLRWGQARLARDHGDDPESTSINMAEIESGSDGIFADHDEFERAFMALALQHPGVLPLLVAP